MNKKIKSFIIIFILINSAILFTSTICHATVWLSPLKIHASANVTTNESVFINKSIFLKNDENQSVIVYFEVTNYTVIFEHNSTILEPFEETFVYPLIQVSEGINSDSIIVKSSQQDSSINGSGAHVTTSMVIKVSSIGTLVNTNNKNENKTNKISGNNSILASNNYLIFIPIILFIIFTIYIMFIRRLKNKS